MYLIIFVLIIGIVEWKMKARIRLPNVRFIWFNSSSNVDGPESDEESVVEVSVKKHPDVDSSAVKKKS